MVQYSGPGVIPDGYTGKIISVMECPEHGAHVNLDVIMTPNDAWESAKAMAAASTDDDAQINGGVPFMVDQLTPQQAAEFAADLIEAAKAARAVIDARSN